MMMMAVGVSWVGRYQSMRFDYDVDKNIQVGEPFVYSNTIEMDEIVVIDKI